jgi:hypothetical protein
MSSQDGSQEWVLVERCLVGDGIAWRLLWTEYRESVRKAARALLGPALARGQALDEIEQRVWVALWDRGGRRLRTWDPERGCLATYLALVTREQVRRWRRQRWGGAPGRVPLPHGGLVDGRTAPWQAGVLLEELAGTLTPRERRYLEWRLGRGGRSEPCPFSDAHRRKLRQRVRRKAEALLGRP